jgi:AcrR family transcriptional regulator
VSPAAVAIPPEVDLTLPASSPADRIADAALRCIAGAGVRATTVEAIAVEAGVGRATVYRHFPGGRAEVILAAGHREIERFATLLVADLDAATTLEDLLVVAVHGSAHALRTSGPIQELLCREPELVLPHLGFDRMPEVFVVGADLLRPYLRRFLPDDRSADRVAEWVTRIVLSHQIVHSADVDLDDPDAVRTYLRRFVLPGLTTASTRTATP